MNQSVSAVPNYGLSQLCCSLLSMGKRQAQSHLFCTQLESWLLALRWVGGGGLLQHPWREKVLSTICTYQSPCSDARVGVIFLFILWPGLFIDALWWHHHWYGRRLVRRLFTALLERAFDRKHFSMTWLMSFIIGGDGALRYFLLGNHMQQPRGHFIQNRPMLGIALGRCGIDLCFIFLGGKTND